MSSATRDRFTKPEPHWCSIGFVKHFARIATRRKLMTLWERVSENV